MKENNAIEITGVSKQYRLGVIGSGTLQKDIQSYWARVRGKEDPNSIIGAAKGSYNDKEYMLALDGIDLEIKKGEALGIIGHNGAGKSTLLKLLSRVTAPTAGEIRIRGRISSMLEVGTGFHPELTGRENIYLNGAILGMTRAEVSKKIDKIIEFSECEQFIDTPVKRYSSGMYVKLAFSVAAHLDSEIIIMDEVLAVGDIHFQQKCLDKMREAAVNDGRTVLYVSHNMNTIRQLCSRCIVMDHGKIIFDGGVSEAISNYIERSSFRFSTDNDYSDRKLSPNVPNDARIASMHFTDTQSMSFDADAKIHAAAEIHSDKDYDSLNLRVSIRSLDGMKIGAATVSRPIAVKSGETKNADLEFDFSPLTAGKYTAVLTLYTVNDKGLQNPLFFLDDAFCFEIVANSAKVPIANWDAGKLGCVVLPQVGVKTDD